MNEKSGRKLFDIHKEELAFSILMCLYFFLVITSFWILKPIKKALFIDYYKTLGGLDLMGWHMLGSQAELIAKVLNMVLAAVAVGVFTVLCRKFVRQQLSVIFSAFFILCFFVYVGFLKDPSGWGVWSFYLFGDLYNTIMVATFFAFLNDSVTPDAAKRLYGLIVFGGVAGGVVGTTAVKASLKSIPNPMWMVILAVGTVVLVVIAIAAGKLGLKLRPATNVPENVAEPAAEKKGNAALEGARLVFSSRYLLSIVAIVGLYEMVSTIMDFQFTSTVEHFVTESTKDHFATVYTITNVTSMVVQLFLTSFVMRRFGVGIALLVLPVASLLGSSGFLLLPILFTGSALNTLDNAFNYSINQSAKESLYVPTTKDEKYKAKAFIDMFVQRSAKAVAVGLSLLITTLASDFGTIRWLSLLTVLILIGWILAARFAGKSFDAMTRQPEAA